MSKNPVPQGKYKPAVRHGNLVFTAGMTPRKDGALLMSGKISTTVLFGCLTLMVLCPNLKPKTVDLLAWISMAFLLLAFGDYVRAYFGKNKKIYDLE